MIDPFETAGMFLFGYIGAFAWLWFRAEQLRSGDPARRALPSRAAFFSGSAALWLWTSSYKRISDGKISSAVLLARACLGMSLTSLGVWVFSGG